MARLEWHKQAIEGMGCGHVAVSEECHGPYQKLGQQPRRYEQRTKGMSKEETQALKDLVAMYKKAEDSCVDSFDAEDVQRPIRMLRKVDIDELDFEALCDDLDEWRALQ